MKFLHSQLRDFENRWKNGKVFLEETDFGKGAGTGEADKKKKEEEEKKAEAKDKTTEAEKLDRLMKRGLLYLSVNDLSKISKGIEDAPPNSVEKKKLEKKFRSLTEYYVTLSTEDEDKLPSRMLARIYQEPYLRDLLSDKMKKTLKKLTTAHFNKLRDIVTKNSEWTDIESIRVCTLYHSLAEEGKKDDKWKPTFDKTEKILKKKRGLILDKFEVNKNVDNVVMKGKKPIPPTKEERLFLLEVGKLFPPSKKEEWSGRSEWERLQQKTIENILKDIFSSTSKEKIRPGNHLLWETLQEVDFADPKYKDMLARVDKTPEEVEEAIGNVLARWNGIQLLVMLRDRPVMLATHLEMLKEIVKDEKNIFGEVDIFEYQDVGFEDNEQLVEIRKKLFDLKEKQKRVDDQLCNEVLEKTKKEEKDPKETGESESDIAQTEVANAFVKSDKKEKEAKIKIQELLGESKLGEFIKNINTKEEEIREKLEKITSEIDEAGDELPKIKKKIETNEAEKTTTSVNIAKNNEALINVRAEIEKLGDGENDEKKELIDKRRKLEIKESQLSEERKKLETEGGNLKDTEKGFSGKIKDLTDKISTTKGDRAVLEDIKKDLHEKFEEKDVKKIQENLDSSISDLQAVFSKCNNVSPDIKKTFSSFIGNVNIAVTEFKEAATNLKHTQETFIKNNGKFSAEILAEREALQKEADELDQKRIALSSQNEEQRQHSDVARNLQTVGKDIEKVYYVGLKDRVKNHTLRSADLDVLWTKQEDDKHGEYTKGEFKKYNEFRTAFAEKIDAYLGKKCLFNPDDSVSEWIEALDHSLSDVALAEEFNLNKKFKDVHIDVSVLAQGAKIHFREKIKTTLEKAIESIRGEEAQAKLKEFSKRYGISLKVEDRREVLEIESQKGQFLSQETSTSYRVENEKKKSKEVLENPNNIRFFDEKGERTKEGEAIENAIDYRAKIHTKGRFLKKGDKDSQGNEITEDVYIPGQEDINAMAIKTQESTRAIKKTIRGFAGELQSLGALFEKLHSSDAQENESVLVTEESLEKRLAELLSDWNNGGGRELKRNIDTQKEACLQYGKDKPGFNENFVDKYYENVYKVFNKVDRYFKSCTAEAGDDGKLTGETKYFTLISEELRSLQGMCDFRDGRILAEESARQRHDYKSQAKVLKRLEKEGLWKEKEVDGFKEKLGKIKTEYTAKFSQYKTNVRAISRVIEGDIRNLNDKVFIDRYKIDKSAAQKIVEGHQSQDENFQELWNDMTGGDPNNFESNWVEDYKKAIGAGDGGKEMNDVLDRLKNIEEITSNIAVAEQASGELADWLKDYNEKKSKRKGAFGRFRFNAEEFSLYDVYRVFKDSFEAANKHWKRNSDKHVATIGVNFWGEDNRWGREFARMAEESESARFKEFETQYHDQPGWVILKAMRRSKNPDMVRGCINLLSEKGFLRWDDPILWEVLNRLSRNTYFNIPEDNNLSPHEILEKVKLACEDIWTPEVFRQWETGLEGNLKKAREQYDGEFLKYENDSNARTDVMAGMLQRWSQGEVDDVDPARYEHFLYASFDKGKMNGQPDQRWYFMIMGVATRNPRTGQALISKDVFMRMNSDFLQRFPFVDFLADKESPKLNGRIVPEGTPGARGGKGKRALWNENDYQNWARMLGTGDGSFNPKQQPAGGRTEAFFYQVINESLTCKQRVQRMGRFAQAPDHDDGVNYQFAWDQNRVMENLNVESSGRGQFSEDFWRSWLSGFDKYVRNKKAMIAHGDMTWGGQPFWEEDRKRHLREVGKSLKVALTVTQTLQGNKKTQRGPTTFNQEEWEKESDYSINGEASRQNINDLFRFMMQEKGTNEYNDILDKKMRDRFGQAEKERESQQDWKDNNVKVTRLLDSDTGDNEYFKQEGLIERALNSYCASTPERAPAECIW